METKTEERTSTQRYYRLSVAVLPPIHGRYYRTCATPKPECFKVRASAVLPPPAERYYRPGGTTARYEWYYRPSGTSANQGAVLPDPRDGFHPELPPIVSLRPNYYK